MKIASNRIPEPGVRFFSLGSREIHSDLWAFLEDGVWRNIQPEIFIQNTLKGDLLRAQHLPVLNDFVPLCAGLEWDSQQCRITQPAFVPWSMQADLPAFLKASGDLFRQFEGRHIGVQLSGGFDSSLIIAMLRYHGIPFSLVGMKSDRYEFRTERYIQEILAEWGEGVDLISYEHCLPLSACTEVPPHQYPDLLSLNYASNRAMAQSCKMLGIEVLFTGNGGDNVFAESIPRDTNECSWLPLDFSNEWLDDLVYAPQGIKVVPFYAEPQIMNCLYHLRKGQPEDNSKIWARQFFWEFLPRELVEYSYCADFWGLYIDGLQNALPMLQLLCEQAFAYTENDRFSPRALKSLFGQDFLNAHKTQYQTVESYAAIAIWLNSLFENRII
jgi:hypothetical protein